jgi:hypothetical protein
MDPPSEQLIRDYLNRLSLAAKARLEPRDRQALLDDTRARIDNETGSLSRPTAAQARRILAALGDPTAVAENERARIAALRGPAFGSRANGSIRQIWPPPGIPAISQMPASQVPASQVPARQVTASQMPARQVPARAPAPMRPLPRAALQSLSPGTASLPVAVGRPAYASNGSSGSGSGPPSPTALSRLAEPASSGEPSGPEGASGRAGPPGSGPRSPSAPRGLPSQRTPRGLPSPGVPNGVPPPREAPASSSSPPPVSSPPLASSPPPGGSPARGNSPAPDNAHAPGSEPAPPAGQSEQDKAGPEATPGRGGTDHSGLDEDEPGVELSVELPEPLYEEAGRSWLSQRAGAAAGGLARFGSALAGVAVRDPLETIAVLVLGIGGAIYQPVWLVGALIAVVSRKWDLRDKWFGLAGPVVVVIVGATLAIVLGGQHTSFGSYAFEAWLALGRLSRIAAVLSAGYLLWRAYKGPREPREPPWSMPRRRG